MSRFSAQPGRYQPTIQPQSAMRGGQATLNPLAAEQAMKQQQALQEKQVEASIAQAQQRSELDRRREDRLAEDRRLELEYLQTHRKKTMALQQRQMDLQADLSGRRLALEEKLGTEKLSLGKGELAMRGKELTSRERLQASQQRFAASEAELTRIARVVETGATLRTQKEIAERRGAVQTSIAAQNVEVQKYLAGRSRDLQLQLAKKAQTFEREMAETKQGYALELQAQVLEQAKKDQEFRQSVFDAEQAKGKLAALYQKLVETRGQIGALKQSWIARNGNRANQLLRQEQDVLVGIEAITGVVHYGRRNLRKLPDDLQERHDKAVGLVGEDVGLKERRRLETARSEARMNRVNHMTGEYGTDAASGLDFGMGADSWKGALENWIQRHVRAKKLAYSIKWRVENVGSEESPQKPIGTYYRAALKELGGGVDAKPEAFVRAIGKFGWSETAPKMLDRIRQIAALVVRDSAAIPPTGAFKTTEAELLKTYLVLRRVAEDSQDSDVQVLAVASCRALLNYKDRAGRMPIARAWAKMKGVSQSQLTSTLAVMADQAFRKLPRAERTKFDALLTAAQLADPKKQAAYFYKLNAMYPHLKGELEAIEWAVKDKKIGDDELMDTLFPMLLPGATAGPEVK